MSKPPARGTVSVAMTHRRSKGALVGTPLKPDPDKPKPAVPPVVPAAPETEPETTAFVERPRKAPDIYISRPELGPKR
jgi:hypothetical protein